MVQISLKYNLISFNKPSHLISPKADAKKKKRKKVVRRMISCFWGNNSDAAHRLLSSSQHVPSIETGDPSAGQLSVNQTALGLHKKHLAKSEESVT